MSSLPVPSPDQRFQQLESAVFSLIAQVAELTRDLQSARNQREALQRQLDELTETVEMNENCSDQTQEVLSDLKLRVDDLDGGVQDRQQDDFD